MPIVCAWCRVVLDPGCDERTGPNAGPNHGICEACRAKLEPPREPDRRGD